MREINVTENDRENKCYRDIPAYRALFIYSFSSQKKDKEKVTTI